MARNDSTLPISFFKIILQTNLETIKIPNMFTRSYGVGLPNPVFINPPDGTAWKVCWKNINGEIWFEEGWKSFTQNYSLQHGCLVVFTYKEGCSVLDVVIIGQDAVEIDYDSSSDTSDNENDNVDHISSDDESVEILNEWPNQKESRKRLPLVSPTPHKKARDEIEKTIQRTSSLNRPKGARAREVAANFISSNPFFTIQIKPNHLETNVLWLPNLRGIIENKEKNVMLQSGNRSWYMKLLQCYEHQNGRYLTSGWSLFASEGELKLGDVCVFEIINKDDLVFMVHVF